MPHQEQRETVFVRIADVGDISDLRPPAIFGKSSLPRVSYGFNVGAGKATRELDTQGVRIVMYEELEFAHRHLTANHRPGRYKAAPC